MLGVLCLLLLLPLLIGMTARKRASVYIDTFGMSYTCGFLVVFVLFGVLYFPCLLVQVPLHVLTRAFLVVCGASGIFCVILLICKKGWKEWKNPLVGWKHLETSTKLIWITAILFIAFQLFRVVVLQTFEFRDDKTYNALVNDMVSWDLIYGTSEYGMLTPIEQIPLKYRLSAWMPLEAVLSQMTGYHPLIICRTILPAIVLVCHYSAMDFLGKWLFSKNMKGRALFLLFIAVLNQTCSRDMDQALIVTHWPAWGKSVVSSIVLPLILAIMMKIEQEEKKWVGVIMLCIVLFAGMLASPMGYLIPPVEIVILWIVLLIRKKWRKRHGDAAADI